MSVKNNIPVKNNQRQFNLKLTDDDAEVMKQLRERHSVNLSALFRSYIRELLAKLDKAK